MKQQNARRIVARELVDRLQRGPSWLGSPDGSPLDPREGYKRWVETWVLPDLKMLLERDLAPRNRKEAA